MTLSAQCRFEVMEDTDLERQATVFRQHKDRGQRSASNAMISSSLPESTIGPSLNIFVLQKSRLEPAIYPIL